MTENKIDISLVIPLLNEAESLPELHAWIKRVMTENKLSYEVVFVDDGSKDGSWNIIESLTINLSKREKHSFQQTINKFHFSN